MRKQTIAALALKLNYTDSKILSQPLLEFIRSRGISRKEFVKLDRNTIDAHASSFVRESGRRYWGTSGRSPSLPEHEPFIVHTIADILVIQQKNAGDALKALERRQLDSSPEEADEYNDEELGSENGESGDLDVSGAISAVEPATEQANVRSRIERDSNLTPLLSEMPETSTRNRASAGRERNPANHIDEDGTARGPGRASTFLHAKSPQATRGPAKTSGPDMVLRSHKRDRDAMEIDPVSPTIVALSAGDGASPAAKQRRTAIDLVDSAVDVGGSSYEDGASNASSRFSKPATALSFSGVNTTFSSEPVPEKGAEPPSRVQTFEAATQTEERLHFEFGWTSHSLERRNLEPLFYRTLSWFTREDLEFRNLMQDKTDAEQTLRNAAGWELLKRLRQDFFKELRLLGAVSVD